MESKRQKQVAEIVKRHFSIILQQEGINIYGAEPLVTVTNVKMTPDMSLAKIYLSVYNMENKQNAILLLESEYHRLKSHLYQRIRKHTRRMPDFKLYLDDTLDEMYRLNQLFDRLEDENQMGSPSANKDEEI